MTGKIVPLSPALGALVKNFKLPEHLGFGTILAPVMARCVYNGGVWSDVELVPFEPLQLSPATKALHYGQLIFEGMKAYYVDGRGPYLFRPEENAKRMQRSADRLGMPEIPIPLFVSAVASVVAALTSAIPTHEGESLYLRPLMLASGEGINLSPSQSFLFLVLASPSGTYFSSGEVRALIERDLCRAAPGGTGYAKAAGNYAASFRSTGEALRLGFQQVLWLDAVNKRNIEEFSGMNFFARIDNTLYTPRLNSSILPGVTRESLLLLAKSKGIASVEGLLDIDEVIARIKDKRCTEIFTCGTAAIITPVAALGEKDGRTYQLPTPQPDGWWNQLRNDLLGIQNGRLPDPFGWRYALPS